MKLSRGFCSDGFLDCFDYDTETGPIVHSHFGELLSIDFDLGQHQPVDEFAVSQAVHAGSCIDSNDPKSSEITTFAASIAISEPPSSNQIFFGRSIETTTTSNVALSSLE